MANMDFCKDCRFYGTEVAPDTMCARETLESAHEFLGGLSTRTVLGFNSGEIVNTGTPISEMEAYYDVHLTQNVVDCIDQVSSGGEPINPKQWEQDHPY